MGFVEQYGPWALVAGASEGIGAAFCRALAARGVHVVLVARREEPLRKLAAELERAHGVQTRVATVNLGLPDVVERLEEVVEGIEVGLVVYNACYSVVGRFLDVSIEDKLSMMNVNCRGVLMVADYFGRSLARRGRGGLVVMSSMSGFQGSAMVGTYAATKAFDTVLGEMLWEELGALGVDVLVCAAGATTTPGFERVTPKGKRSMAFPMEPASVAEGALLRLGQAGPTWVPGWLNRLTHAALARVMTRRRAVRFISSTTRSMYEGQS